MSFAAAVQWWEDWQLRLLVLASLFFQYFLFAAAVVRKLRVPPWFRALIWLAYQGGDVVAVYALATLFNRHKEEALAAHPASAHLDTLWAPVLLLHLGGQDGITAYSIEDNENWRRHLLISVSQITVAIYVFRKSWWSGDTVLLRAAILLFVPGILKCLEKPWALKNATVTSIMNSSDPRLQRTFDEDDVVRKQHQHIRSQEEYVQAAAARLEPQPPELLDLDDELADEPYHLFVDVGHPYSIRLRNLYWLVAPRCARADAHALVRSSLSRAFDRLYTKHRASFGGLLRAAVVLLTFADIGLFHRSHRREYDRADVVVTYVLLCCTAALELVSACLVLGSGLPPPDDLLPQYNLVGYLARGEKRPRFWALADLLGARLQLDRLWRAAPPEPSSLGVTRLVYDHLAAGWKDYIWRALHEHDATAGADGVGAYRRFNDGRGQRTLEREGCRGGDRMMRAVEESMRMPFDEGVVLWHLATELCYFDHVDTGHDATRHSRMVSNYMAYLLVVEPEMLVPGARSGLFGDAYRELRKLLRPPPEEDEEAAAVELEPTEKKAPPPRTKDEMMRKVIQEVKSTMGLGLGSENVVHKAWAVANELKEFAEVKKQEFVRELQGREEQRMEVRLAMASAKEKADEIVLANKNKAQKSVEISMAEQLTAAMRNVKEKAKKFIDEVRKAEEKIKQTKEERKMTDLLNLANKKADMFISKQETKTTTTRTVEEEQAMVVVAAEEFSRQAGEVIRLEEEEDRRLADLVQMNLVTSSAELLAIRGSENADDRMWAVIQGVWVEMLCFSAGRCRGYLHAKSLGNGGEYLSYVWLLMSYMGMETMPERMQRPEPPAVGDTGALVNTPTDEDMDEGPAQPRAAAAPTTPASSRPGVTTAESLAAGTSQAPRLVATPMPAISATAVVPVGDDIV